MQRQAQQRCSEVTESQQGDRALPCSGHDGDDNRTLSSDAFGSSISTSLRGCLPLSRPQHRQQVSSTRTAITTAAEPTAMPAIAPPDSPPPPVETATHLGCVA